MAEHNVNQDSPISDSLHPLVNMAIIGPVLMFVAAVWIFFDSDPYGAWLDVVITGLFVIAIAIPTLELFPDSDYPFWIGIFMPARTPRDIVEKFHREAVKTMQLPNVKERLETLGMEPMPLTPAEFDARVRAEIGTTGVLARAAGLKPNQ
jgi:Tripartite tricarboxylate transporter family receptor